MKSLSLKLVLLYVISVFFIVSLVFFFMEDNAYRQSLINSMGQMEAGPGYINGATPATLEDELRENRETINDALAENSFGLTSIKVIDNFQLVVDIFAPGGVRGTISIDLLPDLKSSNYNVYLLNDSASQIGPVILTDNYFPETIQAYELGRYPTRRLYYAPVKGYSDMVMIASLDTRFLPDKNWLKKVPSDVILASPLVLVSALILGWAITRMTVSPVTRLTRFSEKLAAGDLEERTAVTSKDELGRLANSLNRMAAKIQGTFNSQKKFVSDAAHELRTPLASMKTAVTGALDRNKTPEEYHQLLDLLSRRITSQERLINDLLLQTKADESDTLGSSQSVDIAAIIAEVSNEFEPLFEDNRVTFSLNLAELSSDKHVYVRGDAAQLSRLFSNLLDNAAKNTPAGGKVTVHVATGGDKVIIKVRDTGRGIAPEHLDKIFDRFYKVSAERTPETGFGLGLSISRGIAIRHGGDVTVESVLGEGSVFTVKLPLFEITSAEQRVK